MNVAHAAEPARSVRRGAVQRACACASGQQDCACGKGGTVQRDGRGPAPAEVPEAVAAAVRSPGRPLDMATRVAMEQRLGHDFSSVRVHADHGAAAASSSVHASAFTVGSHVVFGAGRFSPGTSAGRRLLAHELTHTVQQRRGERGAAAPGRLTLDAGPGGADAEREADRAAAAVDGGAVDVGSGASSPGSLQRQVPSPIEPQPDVSLTLRWGSGDVDVIVGGPKLPGIEKPGQVGLRRNRDGSYTMTFGADNKIVAASEVPALLRGLVPQKPVAGAAPRTYRYVAPSCASLRVAGGGRFMTFDEYRRSQILAPDFFELTPALYQTRLATCRPDPLPAIPAPPPRQEAPPGLPPLPEGQAYA